MIHSARTQVWKVDPILSLHSVQSVTFVWGHYRQLVCAHKAFLSPGPHTFTSSPPFNGMDGWTMTFRRHICCPCLVKDGNSSKDELTYVVNNHCLLDFVVDVRSYLTQRLMFPHLIALAAEKERWWRNDGNTACLYLEGRWCNGSVPLVPLVFLWQRVKKKCETMMTDFVHLLWGDESSCSWSLNLVSEWVSEWVRSRKNWRKKEIWVRAGAVMVKHGQKSDNIPFSLLGESGGDSASVAVHPSTMYHTTNFLSCHPTPSPFSPSKKYTFLH